MAQNTSEHQEGVELLRTPSMRSSQNTFKVNFRESPEDELSRILFLRTPVNKPEIKAGLWRWTSLGLLVPGKYGGIENDPDRQS
jgi:hypothetical protein